MKSLTYESARNLKELELLEKMETIEELNDEINYLEDQIEFLKKERNSALMKKKLKEQQMKDFESQFKSSKADDYDSEIFRSFSKREGFQEKLKLGDLVTFTKEPEPPDEEDWQHLSPERKVKSRASSTRHIHPLTLSVDGRKKQSISRQSIIFKNMQKEKSEREKQWERFGFRTQRNLKYKLTSEVSGQESLRR